jgi:hypothetical protein
MEILKYLVSLSIPMSQKTMVDSRTQNQKQGMSDTALENLTAIEDEIETNSQYFKPKPDKVYMISINPEERISPRLNERFKTVDGIPTIRYEIKITHVNNGKQQLWETSKTLCAPDCFRVKERIQSYTCAEIW